MHYKFIFRLNYSFLVFYFQSSYQNSKRVNTNRAQSISISDLMQNPKDKLDLELKSNQNLI